MFDHISIVRGVVLMKCFRLFTAIILASVFYPQTGQAKQLTFAIDDYCPYYCKDKASTPASFLAKPGYIIEILNRAFADQGYQVKYTFLPWERGLAELHKNTIDGIIVTAKPDAPELVYPEQEQGYSIGCFVTQQKNPWRYKNRDSLNEVRLGVIQGYRYGQPVDSFIRQYHKSESQITIVSGTNALPRLLNMVAKNRIDAVIDDKSVLQNSLKRLKLEQTLGFAGCTDNPIKLYVGFAPNNPDSIKHARMLSDAMTRLRKSGEMARILEKYHVSDWLQQ